jgi:hypothetical protein
MFNCFFLNLKNSKQAVIMQNWQNIDYLKSGTPSQQQTWSILKKTNILIHLFEYNPIVIGSIPINIDINGSDIDIACEVYKADLFIQNLTSYYPKISITQRTGVVIGRMSIDNMDFEIYGENRPVNQQSGYIHMLVEAMLLELGGNRLRQQIRQLKKSGLKSEPAFAQYLKISGDPYIELLNLSKLSLQQMEIKFFKSAENR